MSPIPRRLNLPGLLARKSQFLFGPRATGKSTLIQQQLPEAQVYDLLDAETFRALIARPKLLEERLGDGRQPVVIDEIQKLPSLLDEVHRLIEKRKVRFLLTGSSARKLRRGGANLLAGRAWEARLFPLTWQELGGGFDLLRYLNTGGLPAIHASPDAKDELAAYVGTYLQEEIQAEAVTRNLASFSEFLTLAALSNGQEINFESMAIDCGVSPGTLKNYFQVLSDTLVGLGLPGFTRTRKRKAISRAKHYFFDVGVVNQLAGRGEIAPRSELFGAALEHFLVLEVRAYNSYSRTNAPLHYWRSTSKMEVDLVVGPNLLAVELKATALVQDKHLKGLRALKEEGLLRRYLCVSLDEAPRRTADGIEILPWQTFLERLWAGALF